MDITTEQKSYNTIKRILGNPTMKVIMRLPEKVFAAFNFDRYIYLKHKDFQGKFFVEKIENYKDGNTPVKVYLNDVSKKLTGVGVDVIYDYNLQGQYIDNVAGTPEWGIVFQYPPVTGDSTTMLFTGSGSSSNSISGIFTSLRGQAAKQSNGGIAEGNGTIRYYRNGVLENTENFVIGNDMLDGTWFYDFLSVNRSDTFKVEVTEG